MLNWKYEQQYIPKFSRISVHSLHAFPIYVTHHYWKEPSVDQESDCGGGSEGWGQERTACTKPPGLRGSRVYLFFFPQPRTFSSLLPMHTWVSCDTSFHSTEMPNGREKISFSKTFKEVISKSIKTLKKISFSHSIFHDICNQIWNYINKKLKIFNFLKWTLNQDL